MADLKSTTVTTSLNVIGTATSKVIKNTLNSPNHVMMGDGTSKTFYELFNNNVFTVAKIRLGPGLTSQILGQPDNSNITISAVSNGSKGNTFSIELVNALSYIDIDFRQCLFRIDNISQVLSHTQRKLRALPFANFIEVINNRKIDVTIENTHILYIYNRIPLMSNWYSSVNAGILTANIATFAAKSPTAIAKINNLHSDVVPASITKDVYLAQSNQDNKWYEINYNTTSTNVFARGAIANGFYIPAVYKSLSGPNRTLLAYQYTDGSLVATTTYTIETRWYDQIVEIIGTGATMYWLANNAYQQDAYDNTGACGIMSSSIAIARSASDLKWYMITLSTLAQGAVINGYIINQTEQSEVTFDCYVSMMSYYVNGTLNETRFYRPRNTPVTGGPPPWTDWAEKKFSNVQSIASFEYDTRVADGIMPALNQAPPSNTYGWDSANGSVYVWTSGQNPGTMLTNGYWAAGATWGINDWGQSGYIPYVIFEIRAGKVADYFYFEFYTESGLPS